MSTTTTQGFRPTAQNIVVVIIHICQLPNTECTVQNGDQHTPNNLSYRCTKLWTVTLCPSTNVLWNCDRPY